MANEIKAQQQLSVSNAALVTSYPPSGTSSSWDQAAQGGPTPGFVKIGTTEESIAFGELTTVGWLLMHNLDASNYVQWGFSTAVYGGRMEAGEKAGPFRLEPGTTIYIKANAAECKCYIAAFED